MSGRRRCRRCKSSLTWAGLALGGDLGKAPTVALQRGGGAGKTLPAFYDHIDISRADLQPVTAATLHLRGDDCGTGTEERVINGLAGAAGVQDRPAHALHWFLSAVPVPAILAG